MVMPASNILSEKNFSAMKSSKTCLRSSTNDNRLQHLMMSHIHWDISSDLDMIKLCNLFVAYEEYRHNIFGKFIYEDLIQI